MAIWDFWQARREDPMTRLVRAYVYEGSVPPQGLGADGWNFVQIGLEHFSYLSRAHQFKAALVILPLPQEVLNTGTRATYSAFLVERSRALGITPIEVLRDLRASGYGRWERLIPYDYHFTKEGHRVIAESLARTVHKLAVEARLGGETS